MARKLLPLLVGLLGTLLFFWAQFTSGFDTYFGNRSDSRFTLHTCEHWYQAFRGNAIVLSPGMFYPTPGVLGRSDVALGLALPYSCLRSLGLNIFLSLELTVIALTLVAYLLTYGLLRRMLGLSLPAACFGAAFFAFNSPKLALSYHCQLQFVAPLPIFFGCLIAAHGGTTGRRAFLWLSLAGLTLDLLVSTSFYLGWFCYFWCGLWLLLALLSGHGRSLLAIAARQPLAALGGLLVTALGLAPLCVAYLPVLRVQGAFPMWECLFPKWWSLLAMGDGNYVWGWLMARLLPFPRPGGWEECMMGIGLIASAAWLGLTLFSARALRSRHWVAAVTVLTTSLILLINMQYGESTPWAYIHRYVPAGGAVRVTSRWMCYLGLPIGVVLSWALDQAVERWPRWRGALLLLAGLALVEQMGVAQGYSIRTEHAYLSALAARVPRDSEAFYVAAPAEDQHLDSEHQTDAMIVSVMTGVPTLNGWTSRALHGWMLGEVRRAPYEALVNGWIGVHRIKGPVYRLELWPPVESYTVPLK